MLSFNPIYSLNYAPYLGFFAGAPYAFSTSVNNNMYVVAEQAVFMTLYGLKPLTVHKLLIDNIDVTNRAKQLGETLGSGIKTDANGQITLKYYFGSNLTTTTSVEQAAALAGLIVGNKRMIVQSADGSSKATVPISIPDYARTQVATAFKKVVDPKTGKNKLTVITTPSSESSELYYTPETYSYIQTFYVDPDKVGGAREVSISSVDLFFRTKPSKSVNTSGKPRPAVSVAICEVENDSPVISKTLIRSKVKKKYSEVYTYSDASTPTSFGLPVPLKLSTGKSYGIVIMLEDAHYTLWTNVTGNILVGTNTKSPGSNLVKDGNLFARNTSGVFVGRTNEDLKFNINAARYTATENSVTYVNDNFEFFTMANSVGRFLAGESVYKKKAVNNTGTLTVTKGSEVVSGVGTTFTSIAPGDSVVIFANSTVSQVFPVSEIANNTVMTLDSPVPFTVTGAAFQSTISGTVYHKTVGNKKLILTQSNANTTVFAPGDIIVGEDSGREATISTIDKLNVDRLKIRTSIKSSSNGSVVTKLTTSKDVAGTVTLDPTELRMSLNHNLSRALSDKNAVILSRSTEVTNSSLYSNTALGVVNKSFKVDIDFKGSKYISSAIPDMQLDCYVVSHTTANTTLVSGYDKEIDGNSLILGRHIEKKITFESEHFAEDVRVYLSAYRPVGTDVKLYARVHNSQDPDSFDDKSWTPLQYKTRAGTFSSTADDTDIIEYELGLPQYSAANTILGGTFTTTLNSAVLNANGVNPSTIPAGTLVKVCSELFPDNHWVGVVASANSTAITLSKPITTSNVVGSGFKVETLKYKNIAFNNINNSNISRYYNSAMGEFDTYDSLQIKIVFTSDSTYLVPYVDQIQVIGVST